MFSDYKEMFMLTWPGVKTHNLDFYGEREIQINTNLKATIQGGLTYHQNQVISQIGQESLRIFYPNFEPNKSRFLKRLNINFIDFKQKYITKLGLGFGERAPSVSEAYGFYLFNSMDRFDYIGNPNLKNEQSFEANFQVQKSNKKSSFSTSGNLFLIKNYIVGQIEPQFDAMTLGALGVKAYKPLAWIQRFSTSVEYNYQLNTFLNWKS